MFIGTRQSTDHIKVRLFDGVLRPIDRHDHLEPNGCVTNGTRGSTNNEMNRKKNNKGIQRIGMKKEKGKMMDRVSLEPRPRPVGLKWYYNSIR